MTVGTQPRGLIRLLVVDDDALVRHGLRMRLELEQDLEVVGEAKDGAAALRLAHLLAPDVVLMDLVMPELDGLRATEILSKRSPSSAVVALSLYDGPEDRARAREAGAAAFVGKHEPETVLLEAIRRVVTRRRGEERSPRGDSNP